MAPNGPKRASEGAQRGAAVPQLRAVRGPGLKFPRLFQAVFGPFGPILAPFWGGVNTPPRLGPPRRGVGGQPGIWGGHQLVRPTQSFTPGLVPELAPQKNCFSGVCACLLLVACCLLHVACSCYGERGGVIWTVFLLSTPLS